MESDITRYYFEDVEEAIEGKYSKRQFEQSLSEFGYDRFPNNGITDKGFRKLMERVSEIDEKESNLEIVERKGKALEEYNSESKLMKVKKKDLSSKVIETPVKVKKNTKFNDYLPVVGEDLKKIGKSVGYAVGGPIIGFLALPTASRMHSEYNLEYPLESGCVLNILSLYYHTFVFPQLLDFKYAGLFAGIHLGSNLLSGLYEYARHVKKKAIENNPKTLKTHSD